MDQEVEDLEHRGFEFLKREQWTAARECFEEMRQHRLPPIREAKVLANIMLTCEREGRNDDATNVAYEALNLLHASGLDRTMEGTALAGRFKGYAAHLTGVPKVIVLHDVARKLIPLALAYYFGAMLGAYLGASTGWAIAGAIAGFFLLSRYFSGLVGRSVFLSTIGCLSSIAALYKLLVQDAGSILLFWGITAVPIVLLAGAFGMAPRQRA